LAAFETGRKNRSLLQVFRNVLKESSARTLLLS
jgi:hypothetical protein